ncbi:hypothetical protein ACFVMC_08085 [Nocardia sp. NPDC127579]
MACTRLECKYVGLGELAHRLGYYSEAAFGRALERVIGTSPGAVRRRRAG